MQETVSTSYESASGITRLVASLQRCSGGRGKEIWGNEPNLICGVLPPQTFILPSETYLSRETALNKSFRASKSHLDD